MQTNPRDELLSRPETKSPSKFAETSTLKRGKEFYCLEMENYLKIKFTVFALSVQENQPQSSVAATFFYTRKKIQTLISDSFKNFRVYVRNIM